MTDATARSSRRKIWLCISLVFLGGLICGCLIGAFYFKRAYSSYYHPRKRVADVIAERIQKDYQLDSSTADQVLSELSVLGATLHEKVQFAREDIQNLRREYIDRIAGLLPDDGRRERWLAESHRYLPEPRRVKSPPAGDG